MTSARLLSQQEKAPRCSDIGLGCKTQAEGSWCWGNSFYLVPYGLLSLKEWASVISHYFLHLSQLVPPGKMQVYGTTANRVLGLWIHFNKVQVWRSGKDIKCPNTSLSSLFPWDKGSNQTWSKTVSKPSPSSHLYPSTVLGLQENVNAQSLPWLLQVWTQILMPAGKVLLPSEPSPRGLFRKYKHKGIYLGLFPLFILQNQRCNLRAVLGCLI